MTATHRTVCVTKFLLWADSMVFALIAFLSGSMFLSRTYNELMYILIALSVALTNIYVQQSGKKYQLMDTKEFLYGFAVTVAGLVGMQVFLIIAY